MSIRRSVLTAAAIVAASAQPVLAQTRESRLMVSAVIQHEELRIDGGAGGGTAGGVALGLRLWRYVSLHGEATAGSAEAQRSFEGGYRSWRAGPGGAMMVSFHTPQSAQLGVAVSVGASFRDIEHRELNTVTQLPEGDIRYSRTMGGLLVGLAVPVHITSRLTVTPEVRWMRTMADEDYSVGTIGMRAGWMF